MVAGQDHQATAPSDGRGMNAVEANTGTTPVRPGFELDETALCRWMTDNVPGFIGPLRVEQFKGGQSNPTYRLMTVNGDYVLRRKPPGPILKGRARRCRLSSRQSSGTV